MMEDEGDAHTLGLLVDLRDLCLKIADNHHSYASQLHDLLQQVQNPNLHGLDKNMGFRVVQHEGTTPSDQWPEMRRMLSINCSMTLARAAFNAAVKAYPNQRIILKWGALVEDEYDPPKETKSV
jgi:hypothetical protein